MDEKLNDVSAEKEIDTPKKHRHYVKIDITPEAIKEATEIMQKATDYKWHDENARKDGINGWLAQKLVADYIEKNEKLKVGRMYEKRSKVDLSINGRNIDVKNNTWKNPPSATMENNYDAITYEKKKITIDIILFTHLKVNDDRHPEQLWIAGWIKMSDFVYGVNPAVKIHKEGEPVYNWQGAIQYVCKKTHYSIAYRDILEYADFISIFKPKPNATQLELFS